MKKKFNVTAVCVPERHYMVDISERIALIRGMVEEGDYFAINRGRQYGKTTTLYMVSRELKDDYTVLFLSFESADDLFQNNAAFAEGFLQMVSRALKRSKVDLQILQKWGTAISEETPFVELSERITALCETVDKPIVLLIDEVDKSSDNQIFLTFLGLLREKYIERDILGEATFQSVILAGVYDIRNLRLKIRPDSEHKKNSPWNIAADFDTRMSFDAEQIAGMLSDYEDDHHTGMDVKVMAAEIYDYTGGYPYLVSKICKLIDESGWEWNREGINDAVKKLLDEKSPLFDSLMNRMIEYPDVEKLVYQALFSGDKLPYSSINTTLDLAKMFGFIRVENGQVFIANKIFETILYNYFVTTEQAMETGAYQAGAIEQNRFIHDGTLDMDLVVERFTEIFHDIYGDQPERFAEEEGRKMFLLFLKPVINGTGNYYIEAQTRDRTKTDVIVDYLGKRYIIEMKIWRGDSYNQRGEEQLFGYLDYFHEDKGWLISFCFNKDKKIGVSRIRYKDKEIVEAIV